MQKLVLLFTKGGLQYQIISGKEVQEEKVFFITEDSPSDYLIRKLEEILDLPSIVNIDVISALNHFTLMPSTFSQHDVAHQLISYNALVDKDNEEVMLSVNKKYGVQFYYTMPDLFYKKIKSKGISTHFNFSGEKFLNTLEAGNKKEIHINLYHHQCEFFALDKKKVILYNNLDVNSEVDFLYFVMFTLSKIGFNITDTQFYVYGETTENETFISELRKFVNNLKVVFDNLHKRNFIMS
ncbi:DUF3822 family protein [Riemerella anatipestifer]|nr:DUF3822 family protein [Riemerella anatipestifer]